MPAAKPESDGDGVGTSVESKGGDKEREGGADDDMKDVSAVLMEEPALLAATGASGALVGWSVAHSLSLDLDFVGAVGGECSSHLRPANFLSLAERYHHICCSPSLPEHHRSVYGDSTLYTYRGHGCLTVSVVVLSRGEHSEECNNVFSPPSVTESGWSVVIIAEDDHITRLINPQQEYP